MNNEISQKQLEANRNNAKSGGVKTEEGKAVSKYNALKHGLLAQEIVIDSEDINRFQGLCESLGDALQPQGELEDILADRILTNLWRLKRCVKIEKNIMEYNKHNSVANLISIDDEKQGKREMEANMVNSVQMDRLLRYETTIERGIFKALHELERIQAQRRGEKTITPIAVDIDVSNKS